MAPREPIGRDDADQTLDGASPRGPFASDDTLGLAEPAAHAGEAGPSAPSGPVAAKSPSSTPTAPMPTAPVPLSAPMPLSAPPVDGAAPRTGLSTVRRRRPGPQTTIDPVANPIVARPGFAADAGDAAYLQTEASISTPMSAVVALPPRFEYRRSLGSGGMGEVVLAHDKVLGRDVAIKILKTGDFSDVSIRDRLLHEAQAAAQIQHPNIVSIHDVDLDAGLIVMEYLPFGSGRRLLEDRGKLPLREVLHIARQLCAALDAAHQAGLVHRDVKPDNVLFDRDGVVKVADFGVAQSRRRTTSGGSEIVGTPAYMAPEQLRGAAADPRADIYALGLTLYELATGRRFHRPDGPADNSAAGLSRAVRNRGLGHVLSRCLAEDPAHRYESTVALDDALQGLARRRQRQKVGLLVSMVVLAIAVPSVLLVTKRPIIEQAGLLKLAALPFQNGTNETKLEWLQQGFANLISSGLRRRGVPAVRHTQLRDLAGNAPDSAAWSQAAKLAGANEVVQGSFARDGADLVVTATFRAETFSARGRAARSDSMADELANAIAKTLVGEPQQPQRSGRRPEVVRLFELGYAALQQHEFQRSVDILRDVLKEDPDYIDARYALITGLSSMPTPEANLVAEVDKALTRNLTARERALFEALRLRVSRRYEEAASRYDRLRSQYPAEKEAHYGLADSLFHLGRGDQAMAAFKNLVRIAPSFHLAYQHPTEYLGSRGHPREMNAYLYFLRRAMPPPQFLTLMEMRLEESKRQPDRALARGKALQNPGPELLAAVAGAHALVGDLEAAREEYAKAAALAPENWELRIARCALDLTQGQLADFHSDAAWETSAGSEQVATVANRLAMRGLLYALLGRPAEARRDLDEVTASAAPDVQRRLPRLRFLEGLYALLTKDAPRMNDLRARLQPDKQSREVMPRAAEIEPFEKGVRLAALGQPAAGLRKLQEGYKAREDGAFAPVFLVAMARIASAMGDKAAAATHCEELVNPPAYSPLRAAALPFCWGLLAEVRDSQGRRDDARKYARAFLTAWEHSVVEIPELTIARRVAGVSSDAKGDGSGEPSGRGSSHGSGKDVE